MDRAERKRKRDADRATNAGPRAAFVLTDCVICTDQAEGPAGMIIGIRVTGSGELEFLCGFSNDKKEISTRWVAQTDVCLFEEMENWVDRG